MQRFQLVIADILSEFTAMPLMEIIYFKNFVLVTENSFFLIFACKPVDRNFFNICVTCLRCLTGFLEKNKMSLI
jgi:hypothetical protein